MTGKVYLIGAGPGDVGLMTCRARELLAQAEVVVYDALVGDAVLSLVPPEAECINVGKRAGNHTRSQWQINEILLEQALKGRMVVRLKGGDPFLFGRGGEELELLHQNGVPYEIVPGITSAIAVPAYNGIPVTHRDFCSSVHIITAHKKKDQPLDIDFEALVRTKGTLVFLMGVTALSAICQGLLAAGMDPDMPAAVLHRGTSAYQKRVVATVSTLPEAAAAMEAPSIIVVGKVCALAEEFAWAENRPLFGKRFLVTRPRERASELTRRLRELGAEVVEFPTMETRALPEASLEALANCSWLVFTSPSGASAFFQVLKAQRTDIRCLARLKIAALGPGTAKELEKRDIFPDVVPETYDAQGLAKALTEQLRPGDKVFLPCAAGETPGLKKSLTDLPGVEVAAAPVYEKTNTLPPILKPMELLDDHTWAIFASGSAVRGFAAAAGQEDLSQVRALCIGAQTKAQAEQYHMHTKTAKTATLDGLVALALDCDKEEV